MGAGTFTPGFHSRGISHAPAGREQASSACMVSVVGMGGPSRLSSLQHPGSLKFRRAKAAVKGCGDLPSRAMSVFSGSDKRPVILFDGVCNLCSRSVNLALDIDSQENFRFAALQSNAGRRLLTAVGREATDISSIVLVEVDGADRTALRGYFKSDAVLKIAEGLDAPWNCLRVFVLVPAPIRNFFYDVVAENRYKIMGQSEKCRMSDADLEERFIVD